MGIATGEAELRGSDYFGAALNRTARLMAAGHGGQILLDGVTADLLTDVELIALGPKQLRDISRVVDVFQVKAEGLTVDFPPLKIAGPDSGKPQTAEHSNRRTRERSRRPVRDRQDPPVTTLTGVGGVGKTRLALEIGARMAEDFPDGVWVVELASVTSRPRCPKPSQRSSVSPNNRARA